MFKLVKRASGLVSCQRRIIAQTIKSVTTSSQLLCTSVPKQQPVQQPERIKIVFSRRNGENVETTGQVGDTLLDVIINNNIDFDGFGACEGTLTCSTCHLIFTESDFNKLPDKPSEEELDMLDLAYELTDTSRLGCQITLTKDMDGLKVRVPSTINDARS